MESANIHRHHHHLQDQLAGSSSFNSVSLATTTTTPSCFGVATSTTTHAWDTTNSILNTNGYIPRQQENTSLISSVPYTSMAPDLGFHWANNFSGNEDYHSTQDLQNSRVKEVFSDNYYLKYTEMLTSSPSSTTTDDQFILRNEHQTPNNHLNTKQLLKSFSSGNLYPNDSINGGRGFSQIYPSVNVSDLNQTGLTSQAGSFDMNLQALDLLTSSRFNGGFNQSSQNQILRDRFSYGFDHMQQPHEMPIYSSTSKISASSSSNEIGGEGKRTSSKMEQPKAIPTAPKKSRVEARASCPPLKVRKEKLGDRIAALQQLVAPFGKTDTASVLMEAIGYIKFLQDQVETLSVPYMKTSRNKASRAIQGGGAENENHEEQNRDLKCRGLCLVPLSCLSYMTDSGGGGAVWPQPYFGGAT